MQYELWGRRRENKTYEFIEAFFNIEFKDYLLDSVDQNIYYEALILKTEWQKQPACISYREYDKEIHYGLNKRRK